MLNFFQAPNLRAEVMTQGAPWDFLPGPEVLNEWRGLPKTQRRDALADKATAWNVFSSVGGVAPNARVSKENPPASLRGIVVDYDMRITVDQVIGFVNQIKPAYVPNFVEITLSGNVRLVWVFEKEVLVPDSKFCGAIIQAFTQKLGADTLLPGYDKNSLKPAEVWTNGGEWFTISEIPVPWDIVFGTVCATSKKLEFGSSEIPLETIRDEIEKRFPNRWHGPFEFDNLGVRFWDELADNTSGCQVKPDGMLCFTGKIPFVTWDQIFGAAWCNTKRALNLGQAAGETHFDGRHYWQLQAGMWVSVFREDLMLELKTKGISPKPGRGQTASDADRVMRHVQTVNRVHGVGPLINYRPGIVTLDGARVLNTSTLRALEPHPEPVLDPVKWFPWTWAFLHGLFDRPDLHSIYYFLAWLRRAYIAAREYRRLMGQAVFLCGPAENGKTLLCMHYIKPLLGNKDANPYDYFTGATDFNDDLFESFLLSINDEEATTRDETRAKFIAKIKSFVVNPSHVYHPKFCKRLKIDWTGRIFSTLNDDPMSSSLLPEVNSNTRDKLMYFASCPYPGVWDDSDVVEARIAAELPFFARWLLDWSPPDYVLKAGRMGVKSFFDPRILGLSQQQGPAYTLLEQLAIWCLEAPYWGPPDNKPTWIGTASELMNNFSILENMRGQLREWTSLKIGRSLTTLARMSGAGVDFHDGPGQRKFKITKAQIIDQRKEKENEP